MEVQEFLTRLRFSRVVPEERIQEVVNRLAPDEQSRLDLLVQRMVDTQVLTQWQADELRAGRDRLVIGKYRLLDKLGEGGMGVVYLAEQTLMKRRVALKTITRRYTELPGAVERFLREAQLLSRLSHPNIVTPFDMDRDGDGYYLAMALVSGIDLGRRVQEGGPLPYCEAVDIIRQIASGLDHAHSLGIVHRDIKPNNIMIDRNGRAVLLDMGLGKVRDMDEQDRVAEAITSTSHPLGTPQYMSPEQFVRARDVDVRSDIYSLGCTLYACLTARHPFNSRDFWELARLHREASPAPLATLCPDAPAALCAIVARMMEKRPEDRFPLHSQLIEALDALESRTAPPVSLPRSAPEPAAPIGSIAPTVDHAGPPQLTMYHVGRVTLEMVKVPSGQFMAGCNMTMADAAIEGLGISNPQEAKGFLLSNAFEQRTSREFEISRYPITKEQYSHFLAATGHTLPPDWTGVDIPMGEKDKPVTNVNLDDARAFCRWADLRLPTNDEWEKAARGADGRAYPWGNAFEATFCNCNESDAPDTVAVTEFALGDGPYGLRQATGNVWEWVDQPDQPWLRGGSYQSSCKIYGALFTRMRADPDVRREHIGFRVVRSESAAAPATQTKPQARRLTRKQVIGQLNESLVRVPAGQFVRGLNRQMLAGLIAKFSLSEQDLATLVRQGASVVRLPAYRIGKYCVTNAQYLAFVEDALHPLPASWDASMIAENTFPSPAWHNLPVTGVSRTDARAFCAWAGVRLPTNDQWEKAARGDEGNLYPWGNDFDALLCNGAELQCGKLMEVDTIPEGCSPYGLFHATGNAFEWMDDEEERPVVRGGSYDHTCEVYGLVGYQLLADANLALGIFGFRVVASDSM